MTEKIYWHLPYELRRFLFFIRRPRRYSSIKNLRAKESDKSHVLSLKPFLDHRCIFVHIPKCAGRSVARSLFGNDAGSHFTIREYSNAFSRREFKRFFKFTIVRNPWDRLVSAYFFLLNGGVHKTDFLWAQKHIWKYKHFMEFVTEWVNKENIEKGVHFWPQYKFISMPSLFAPRGYTMEIDFVGSFENLDHDFLYIRQKLGIDCTLRYENERVNRHKDFRFYYTDKTREIVANVYREDIDLFSYNFDDSRLKNQEGDT